MNDKNILLKVGLMPDLLKLAHKDRKYQEEIIVTYKKLEERRKIVSFKKLLYTNIEKIIKTYDTE